MSLLQNSHPSPSYSDLEKYQNPNITYKQILEFPIEIFPNEIREFGMRSAESVKAPIDYFGGAVLSAASTLIGKQFKVLTKTDKELFASVWVIGIGKSGTGKSDLQRKGILPVTEVQNKYKQEFDQVKNDYLEQKQAFSEQDDSTEEPITIPELQQIIASNTTIEALKDLLEQGPILLYVDEIAGWIKSMGQYKKGSNGEQEEFLSIADNHIVMVNRKGLRQQIDTPYMSVTGGIQPSKLEQILSKMTDDGFLERFLPCFPNEMLAEYNPNGVNPTVEKRYVEYMSRLLTLNKEGYSKSIGLYSDAKKVFDEYMYKTILEINKDDFDERLESYWRKTFTNLSRLVLIMHLIYVASGEVEVSKINAYTVEAAIKLMDYFKSHFAKVVRFGLGNPYEKKYEALCAFIMKKGGLMEVRALQQSKKFGNAQECRDLLQELVIAGLGEWMVKDHFRLFKKD